MFDSIRTTDLSRLVRNCKQSQEHFRLAAETVEADELSNVFIDYSAQRRDFASVLSNLLMEKGETQPSRIGFHSLVDHPDEVTIQLASNNVETMLNQFEIGETELLDRYEQVIDSTDDHETLEVIRDQHQQIAKARDHIRKLQGLYS